MVQHLEENLGEGCHEHCELIVPIGQICVFDEFGFAIGFVVIHIQFNVWVGLKDAIVAK